MKAIFVVQGEGRGHLTQALALKRIFEREGHQVVEVLVGKSKAREIPKFFSEQIEAPMELFSSPNFLPSKDNRKVNLMRSIAYNALLVPKYLTSVYFLRKHIMESGADIVINFYEVLCGITCSLFNMGIPEVCVAHQYLFLHPSFKMPGKYPLAENWLHRFTQLTAAGATAKLALSIRDMEDDDEQGIKVVPPLLREKAKTVVRYHGDYILGYVLNAGFSRDILKWHEKHPHTKLHFFWDKKDAPAEWKVDDTLTFHQIDDEKFLQYMAGCKAYACTAGFESVCEALYMGKPCMMIPAHVEQQCNAMDAEREMVGVASDDFSMDRLIEFSREYEEDVEFRMWENHADARIMAAIENVYLDYYLRKDNAYEKENDSAFVVATHPLPASGKECIRVFGPILGGCESGGIE